MFIVWFVKNEKDKLDSDALVKAGLGAAISGGVAAAAGWIYDAQILKHPAELKSLGITIESYNWGLENRTYERMQAFSEMTNPHENVDKKKLFEITIELAEKRKQQIYDMRNSFKVGLLVGTALAGVLIYNWARQKNRPVN